MQYREWISVDYWNNQTKVKWFLIEISMNEWINESTNQRINESMFQSVDKFIEKLIIADSNLRYDDD
jgi:hypothetical protein